MENICHKITRLNFLSLNRSLGSQRGEGCLIHTYLSGYAVWVEFVLNADSIKYAMWNI